MKGYKIISLIVLAALAGCAKMETVSAPEQEVAFVVANYANRTKTESVTNEFTSFSSKGYLYAEGVEGAQNFFGTAGETITYDGTSTWNPSHPYYWPKGSTSYINFVSWYANDGSNAIDPDTVSETTFEIRNHTVGANDNILIADEAWRQTTNLNEYYTTGVPTLFHHLLSRVRVNMKATLLTDPDLANVTYEVTLQDAHFEGIYQTGSLKLTNSDLNTTGTKAWTSANNNSTYLWTAVSGSNTDNIAFPDTDITIGTTPTAIQPVRSFLPQALGDGIKMVLTYTVTTKSNGTVTSEESNVPATLVLNTFRNSSNNQTITQWVPNKIYTYNIVIDPRGNEILLNPTLESDWGINDISATVE